MAKIHAQHELEHKTNGSKMNIHKVESVQTIDKNTENAKN